MQYPRVSHHRNPIFILQPCWSRLILVGSFTSFNGVKVGVEFSPDSGAALGTNEFFGQSVIVREMHLFKDAHHSEPSLPTQPNSSLPSSRVVGLLDRFWFATDPLVIAVGDGDISVFTIAGLGLGEARLDGQVSIVGRIQSFKASHHTKPAPTTQPFESRSLVSCMGDKLGRRVGMVRVVLTWIIDGDAVGTKIGLNCVGDKLGNSLTFGAALGAVLFDKC